MGLLCGYLLTMPLVQIGWPLESVIRLLEQCR